MLDQIADGLRELAGMIRRYFTPADSVNHLGPIYASDLHRPKLRAAVNQLIELIRPVEMSEQPLPSPLGHYVQQVSWLVGDLWFDGLRNETEAADERFRPTPTLADELERWAELLNGLPESNPTVETKLSVKEDLSAYRPAKRFIDENVDYAELHKILRANPGIRWRKPNPQRLEIHAGDWDRYQEGRERQGFDALDANPETVSEFMDGVKQRQAKIKKQKKQRWK